MTGWKLHTGTIVLQDVYTMGMWSQARIDAERTSPHLNWHPYTEWQRWFAWYPVRRYGVSAHWAKPWTWRWLWLEQCGWRETSDELWREQYECHYVPWHVAVGRILMGED